METLPQEPKQRIDDENIELRKIELEGLRWKHRRRIAYISLSAVLFILGLASYLLLKRPDTFVLIEASSLFIGIIWAFVSIIGAYMGFSTWADKFNKGK